MRNYYKGALPKLTALFCVQRNVIPMIKNTFLAVHQSKLFPKTLIFVVFLLLIEDIFI